jgi:hypothetical protein
MIESIPELKARRKDIDLSHEAAVGKIAEEEIRYLMARGFSEDEAVGMIIRGFLSIDIHGLPEGLARETKRMFDLTLDRYRHLPAKLAVTDPLQTSVIRRGLDDVG